MTNVLTFIVKIEGLENKIWRKVEITDKRTVADLAYTILSSFDSLAYHLYNIKHGNKRYDCMIKGTSDCSEELLTADKIKLKDIDFSDKKMIMNYDYGSTTTFIITYLKSRALEKNNANHYPYIIDGAGRGMIDDITSEELRYIVNDIDEKGYSDHYFTPGYKRTIKYDYREYDIKIDNKLLKGMILEIKNGYEMIK